MSRSRAFAWFAVALMLSAPLVAVAADEREDSEVDAFAIPVVLILFTPNFLAGIVAGFAGGALFTYSLMSSNDTDVQPYLRLMSARDVSNIMDTAAKFSQNANANYAQLWGMTKEHWIRQAELEAYSEWESGESMDKDTVLTNAALYRNAAIMSANAVAQFDYATDALEVSTAGWGTDETYQDKMTVRFSGPGGGFSSASGHWNADMAAVADARGAIGYVYVGDVGRDEVLTVEEKDGSPYEPGWIYAFSDSTELSNSKHIYTLNKGKHYLSDLDGFEPGIYRISNAVVAGDTLAETQGASSLGLMPGLAFRADGGDANLAYLKGGKIMCNGSELSDMTFQVVLAQGDYPAGEYANLPKAVSLKGMLESYGELLDRMAWTATSAANAAGAVWGIYAAADAKSYTVTTLMNSFNYDGWFLSEGMKKAAELSALSQLGEYWAENGSDLKDLYVALYSAEDMPNAPFVRGSIYDEYGNLQQEDVVYTPFFQTKDVTMRTGADLTVDQNTLIMVWGKADGSLQQWYSDATAGGTVYYGATFAGKGYTLTNTELAICKDGQSPPMETVGEIYFDVTEVNFIDPHLIKRDSDPDPEETGTNWVFVIAMALGLICAAYGLLTRNFVYIALGIGLVLFAVVFAGSIWDWICRQKALGGLL